MKKWNEIEKDVFSYFQWFDKDEASERVGKIPNLSVFSVNASELYDSSDRTNFKNLCTSEIRKVFINQRLSEEYKLYLFVSVEVIDRNSRIEKYRKVWKLLQTKWQLSGLNKGPEIEVHVDEKIFFTSIADFRLENLSMVLEIVSSNPKRYAIIASKKENLLSEKSIKNIFGIAFNNNRGYMDEIDYYNLAIHLCPEDDMIFRWGDSSEEAEIAMIFNSDIFKFFSELL